MSNFCIKDTQYKRSENKAVSGLNYEDKIKTKTRRKVKRRSWKYLSENERDDGQADERERHKREVGRKISSPKREEIALNAVRIESEEASCKL